MPRLKLIGVLAVLFIITAQVWPAVAQQPPPTRPAPEPPRQGDVLWTFAQEPPFYDARVALALATLIDARVRVNGARIIYVEVRGSQLGPPHVDQSPAPPDQVPLLLAAAGYPNLGDLREAGRCQIWSAPPSAAVTPVAPLSQAASQLAGALQSVLAQFDKQTQPCLTTSDVNAAHLLVWVYGGPAPIIPQRQPGTFLTGPEDNPAVQAPGFTPPRTGDGGLSGLHD